MLLSLLPAVSGAVSAVFLVAVYYSARKTGLQKRQKRLLCLVFSLFAFFIILWGVLRNFFPAMVTSMLFF